MSQPRSHANFHVVPADNDSHLAFDGGKRGGASNSQEGSLHFRVVGDLQALVGWITFTGLDTDRLEMSVKAEHLGSEDNQFSALAREGIRLGLFALRRDAIFVRLNSARPDDARAYVKAGFKASTDSSSEFMCITRADLANADRSVALMQPMFLPWLGLFEMVDAADTFIFLDDFQFSRQGWGHRNRLFLSPGRLGMLSLNIEHPNSLAADFRDIKPRPNARWLRKTLASLAQTYGKAPFFHDVMNVVEPYLEEIAAGQTTLAETEIGLTLALASLMGISADIRRSSEFAIDGLSRSERVLALIEAVGGTIYYAAQGAAGYMLEDGVFTGNDPFVLFQDFQPRPYSQPWSDNFEPRLSVIDLLFSVGPGTARAYLRGTPRWLGMEEIRRARKVITS